MLLLLLACESKPSAARAPPDYNDQLITYEDVDAGVRCYRVVFNEGIACLRLR